MNTNPEADIPAANLDMGWLCATCAAYGASDIHLKVGIPPFLRINTRLQPIPGCLPLEATDTERLAKEMASRYSPEDFEGKKSFDCSHVAEDRTRFRVAMFKAGRSYNLVLRRLPSRILTPSEIGLPSALVDLCSRREGLILVTGPTGSGKTTSLASLIDHINRTSARHIMTFEDPVEYIHASNQSIVSQREVGADVDSFVDALKDVLRADPNVILVGEMRDLETIRTAIRAAETGHLVLATTHTLSAAATVNYIVDIFPEGEQDHIRVQLAGSLIAVQSQTLCETADQRGVVAAYELMIVNDAIRASILKDRPVGVDDAIRGGKNVGMQLRDDHLIELAVSGKIAPQTAISRSREAAYVRAELMRRRAL